jgi:putative ABC transport system ATP-binding protein
MNASLRHAPHIAASLVDASKTYVSGDRTVAALDEVSVDFVAGEFTAVMGPSGSGKSTLLQCLAGLDRLSAGQAVIGDVDLGSLNDRDLTLLRRRKVGFVFQAYNLIQSLSAAENLTLTLDLAGVRPDAAFQAELVGMLGLADLLARRPGQMSGGQQQRVAVGRALLAHPEIVFADEPTGNLDTHAGREVLAFLRHAAKDFGQTIVMVTHDPVGASFADRAVFLRDGRLVGDLAAPTHHTVLEQLQAVSP